MGRTYLRIFTMRAAIVIAACLAVASARTFSKKALSTPLARGGGRIVGGTDAYPGEFPHQIMLTRGVGGSLMCGGSIVGSNKVITAGHCCDGMSASNLGVEVGSHSLYEDDDSWNINNDICMLTLEGSISMGSNVGTIGLPSSMEEYAEGTICTVSGWGTTTEGGSLARVLQKVDVPVVSDEHCRDAYGQSEITDSMICAGLDQGGKDSCQGDSGGPFMCGNELSGVVSWGYGCAEAGYPGVYTQTSYFVDWVNSHM